VQLQLAPVRVGELAKRLLVSRSGAGQRGLAHRDILPHESAGPFLPAAVS
jgi:hypothetical protein